MYTHICRVSHIQIEYNSKFFLPKAKAYILTKNTIVSICIISIRKHPIYVCIFHYIILHIAKRGALSTCITNSYNLQHSVITTNVPIACICIKSIQFRYTVQGRVASQIILSDRYKKFWIIIIDSKNR